MPTRVLIGLLCLVVGAALAAAVVGRAAPSPQVYSVGEIQVQRRPWAGRTVLVRGWISGGGGMACTSPVASTCATQWVRLLPAPNAPSGSAELDIVLRRGLPVPVSLRSNAPFLASLPVVGRILFGQLGSTTVHVRLLATSPTCARTIGPCATVLFVP